MLLQPGALTVKKMNSSAGRCYAQPTITLGSQGITPVKLLLLPSSSCKHASEADNAIRD